MDTNTIIYNNGEIELKVSLDSDTIWLTQNQLSELFNVTKQNVSLHIIGIYKDKELNKKATVKKYLTVQKEGNREVNRNLEHYNLDMIISVGYRVNSLKATKFRQWATTVLKNYIVDGYSINTNKITLQRFENIEFDMIELKKKQFNTDNKVSDILNTIESKQQKPSQGIFYDGQIFDAYTFIADILRTANKSIVLIDNYINDTTLTLFSKIPNIQVNIYTHTISKQLKLDFGKYNTQYKNITLKTFKNSHDRFLIIDSKEVY